MKVCACAPVGLLEDCASGAKKRLMTTPIVVAPHPSWVPLIMPVHCALAIGRYFFCRARPPLALASDITLALTSQKIRRALFWGLGGAALKPPLHALDKA